MLLIQLFIIIICIIGVCSIRDKEIKYIILFFLIAYSVQLVLAEIDPYNIQKIDYKTILYFNLQIIFFSIGALCAVNKKRPNIQHQVKNTLPSVKINWFIFLTQVAVFLFTLYQYRRMQAYISSLGGITSSVRDYYYTGFLTGVETYITLCCEAFKLISLFFVFSIITKGRRQITKKEIAFIVMSILTYVLQSLTSMARGDMAAILLVLVLFYFLSINRDPSSAKKLKKYFIIILPIVFVVVAIATFYRGNMFINGAANVAEIDNESELFLQPIIQYFYTPILAFDYAKDSILYFNSWFFGAADFAGFIDFLMIPFVYLDHSLDAYCVNSIVGARMTPTFSFPSGTSWNALFTGASNYYLDFGFLGFIIFPFFHGFLLSRFAYKSRSSSISMLLLVYLFFASFYHLTSSYIQSPRVVFYLIWMYVIYRLNCIKMNGNRV